MPIVSTRRGSTDGLPGITSFANSAHCGHHFTVGATPRALRYIRVYYHSNGTNYAESFTLAIIKRSTQQIVYESPQFNILQTSDFYWYSTDRIRGVQLEANTQYVVAMLNKTAKPITAMSGNFPGNGTNDGYITWNEFTSNDATVAALCDTSYANDGSYENGFDVVHGDWPDDTTAYTPVFFKTNGSTTGTGTVQTWTVPVTGKYRIRATGAQGGTGHNYGNIGGRPASMQGDFDLVAGEQLKILVGQCPYTKSSVYAAGGGGGTFVAKSDNTPLVVAGGGSGPTNGGSGYNARTTNDGPSFQSNGAGGASWSLNGGADGYVTGTGVAYALNPAVSNAKGGGPGSYSNYGGFGGGGATHGNTGTPYPGGGGYSGGNASDSVKAGGGSYNAGTNQVNEVSTWWTGHGEVEIVRLNTLPTAPTNLATPRQATHINDPMPITYQHNDPEGNPQTKTQARWRKAVV